MDLEQALKEGKHGLFTRNLDQARWVKRNSVIIRYWDYVAARRLYGDEEAANTRAATELSPPDATIAVGTLIAERPPHRTERADPDPDDPDPVVTQNFNATVREFILLIRQHGGKLIYVLMGGL